MSQASLSHALRYLGKRVKHHHHRLFSLNYFSLMCHKLCFFLTISFPLYHYVAAHVCVFQQSRHQVRVDLQQEPDQLLSFRHLYPIRFASRPPSSPPLEAGGLWIRLRT